MFADACEKGRSFTRPVVTYWLTVNGEVKSGVGSLVILNDDGWFVSSYHIWKGIVAVSQATLATQQFQAKIAQLKNDTTLQHGKKKNALAQLGEPNGDSPVAWAVQWVTDGVRVVDVSHLEQPDIMIGRLVPFDAKWVTEYPVLRDPAGIRQGTSLVRMGYPFPNVEAVYDNAKSIFNITKRELPIFPIEGIYTRDLFIQNHPSGAYREMFLETSSPGLKGQSGGPILDTRGIVWSIQSNTQNLSLDFDPIVPTKDGKKPSTRKEHQFLNVGWGTHPETLVGFLKEKGIKFSLGT